LASTSFKHYPWSYSWYFIYQRFYGYSYVNISFILFENQNQINYFRFGIISSLIIFIYATSIQNVDPEEYGGIIEIIKEGFMTAFATFLVRKILFEFFKIILLF